MELFQYTRKAEFEYTIETFDDEMKDLFNKRGTGLKSSEMLQYLKDAEFGMSQRGKVTLLIDG
uniref:Uncharacterized protein n=1 Tax=Megaselia scalaris TaxID=36166 RepID=T1GSK1_MEGSC